MLFSLFKNFTSYAERAKNTPGARIIDVRTEEEVRRGASSAGGKHPAR